MNEKFNKIMSMMAAGMNGEGPSASVIVSEPASSPDGCTTSSLVTTASLLTPE